MPSLSEIIAQAEDAAEPPPSAVRLFALASELPLAEHSAPQALTPAAAQQLLATLPALPEPDSELASSATTAAGFTPDQHADAASEQSAHPARPTLADARTAEPLAFSPFDQPSLPPAAPPEPPQIVLTTPAGAVAIAEQITVMFSQPMVALNPHAPPSAATVAAALVPAVPGSWHWQDSRTLVFTPVTRLPMATEYRVSVPALRALSGGVSAATTWSFSTPPPKVLHVERPHWTSAEDAHTRQALALHFDQDIDRAALWPFLRLTANGAPLELTSASSAELAAIRQRHSQRYGSRGSASIDRDTRWVGVQATTPLPPNSTIRLAVLAGAPSAEGPLRTAEEQSVTWQTYAPLHLQLDWGPHYCGAEWHISANNALLEADFDQSLISIEPAVAFSATLNQRYISIKAAATAGTAYTITLAASLRDVFDQPLAAPFVCSVVAEAAPLPPEQQPQLRMPPNALVTLAAHTPDWHYHVYAPNHTSLKAQLWAVEPQDWGPFNAYAAELGTLVGSGSVAVETDDARIDLRQLGARQRGQYILDVEPQDVTPATAWAAQRLRVWLQITDIDLDAVVCDPEVLVWANAGTTGAALADVALELRTASAADPGGWVKGSATLTGATQPDGRARFHAPGCSNLLIARTATDSAILPISNRERVLATMGLLRQSGLRWYVVSDRAIYQPGETVHIKGWARLAQPAHAGGLALPMARHGRYLLQSESGAEVRSGSFTLSASGGLELALALPPQIKPEAHYLILSLGEHPSHEHALLVHTPQRPAFAVTVSAATNECTPEQQVRVQLQASYYTGGPVADAAVHWRVTAHQHTFELPEMDDWTFGPKHWLPQMAACGLSGRTDAAGQHTLALELGWLREQGAVRLSIEGTVVDRSLQACAARTALVVHPAQLYVGLYVHVAGREPDDPMLRGEILVVDTAGRPVADREVCIHISELDSELERAPAGELRAALTLHSAKAPVRWAWRAPDASISAQRIYRITAYVADDHDHLSRSSGLDTLPHLRSLQHTYTSADELRIYLAADQPAYAPGDTALITINAPFAPACGALILHGAGAPHVTTLELSTSEQQVAVALPPEITPSAQVQVLLIDRNERPATVDKRLSLRAELPLHIVDSSQQIRLDVQPRSAHARPGERMQITLAAHSAAGQPLADSEIAVFVVDEALLDLTGYALTDPLAAFYRHSEPYASVHALRQHRYWPRSPLRGTPKTYDRKTKFIGLKSTRGAASPALEQPDYLLRHDFSPLAYYAPSLRTDPVGRAHVEFRLPDTLTRYRVMAVAVHGVALAGYAQTTLTAGLPLMLMATAPQMLRPGDRAVLAVLLHNRTKQPLAVALAARAVRLDVVGAAGYALHIAPHSQAECRIELAARQAGPAVIQLSASAGALRDAISLKLPIVQPIHSETSATYGALTTTTTAEALSIPHAALPNSGGLEIDLASTQLQQTADALNALRNYPYGCVEQRASRLLGIAGAWRWISPADSELQAQISADLAYLVAAQRADGGWGLWAESPQAWPYVTAHVAHALSHYAHGAGLADTLARAADYLSALEAALPEQPLSARLTMRAYAWFVLGQLGQPPTAQITMLLEQLKLSELPPEPSAWLLLALAESEQAHQWRAPLRQQLLNHLYTSAGMARIRTSHRDENHVLLYSQRRVDALALLALLADQPEHTAVHLLARGLLAARQNGHWAATIANAYAILALERYSALADTAPTACSVQLSVGQQALPAQQLTAAQPTTRLHIPMAELLQLGHTQQLTLAKRGGGTLHYRIAVQAAVPTAELPPRSNGFTVARRYSGAEQPSAAVLGNDGRWCFASGSVVHVQLTVHIREARYHVALVDPIPTGCTILNPALATTSQLAEQGHERWPWLVRHSYPDRLEAFAEHLEPGTHTLNYVLRTSSTGTFSVPPPTVTAMCQPELYGRGETAAVTIV